MSKDLILPEHRVKSLRKENFYQIKIKAMKKYLLFFAAAFYNCIAIAQTDKVPFMTKTFANETIKSVEVETSGGSIVVTAVNPSEARVEVYIRSNNGNELSKEEIQKRLDEKYELTVSIADNKVTAIAKRKSNNENRGWKNFLNITFKIFTAKEVSTKLTTSGGSISLSDISGNQDFATSGGSLLVVNVSGKINGVTSGGSINVTNSSDDIKLSTSGGSIVATNNTGNIKLVTSGGSITLSKLSGDIDAITSGGSIKGESIGGTLAASTSGGSIFLKDLTCSVDAATSGGSINVIIKELGQYVKLGTSAGNIDLEIPKDKGVKLEMYASKIKTNHLDNFSGNVEEDGINGTLNGGGTLIKLKAGSGKIS